MAELSSPSPSEARIANRSCSSSGNSAADLILVKSAAGLYDDLKGFLESLITNLTTKKIIRKG